MQPMARFLVTGLNGVTGWNLYQRIARDYPCLGTFRKYHPVFCEGSFLQLDFENPQAVRNCLQQWMPTHVIHAWAMCDLDLCELFPEMAHKVNVEGTRRLVEALAGLPSIKKFIFVSTDHVFDGEKGGYLENDTPHPKHVFGRTRYEAEQYVLESGLPTLVIRPGLVVGKSFQGNKGPRDFLFSRIKTAKPTHYFTDEWRSPIRAEALAERVLRLAFSSRRRIVHLAGPRIINRYELALDLAREEGLPTEFIFPRQRSEDRWARIRPMNLSLQSLWEEEEQALR